MHEVSNSSAVFLRDACAREQISFEELTRGLALERIDASGRIDWGTFVEVLDRFAARAGLAAVERAGARTVDDAFAESIRVIAGAFASSRVLYRAIVKWFAPAAVNNLELAYRDLPDGRAEITIQVPAPFPASLPFFHLTLGSYRAAPRLLGQGDALVDMRVEGGRAVYAISPPPDLTLLARARRAVKVALGARRAIDELSKQQAQLRDSYQALLESRRDLRSLIDRAPNGIFVRQGGVLVYANPSIIHTLGVELVDRRIEDLADPASKDRLLAIFAGEGDAPRDALPAEIRFLAASGRPLTLEVFPPQMIDFDGKRSQLLVANDVTARKELEAKGALAERMASIGTIAAGVAHEINNPLTYVIDNVRRIHEALSAPRSAAAPGELAQMAAEAIGGVERVEVIVRDLKTFARAETEDVAPVDVRGILESAARIAVSEIRQRAVLVFDFEDVPFALGNASRLGQVFLNLVVNAAQAIPEGNVARNEIRISTRRAGERVAIDVKDSGCGIPRENLSRIFQPFYTTKPLGVGTGLGLAICHTIVASMGGEIVVESEVGVGTTFRVLLPVAPTPPPRPKSIRPSAAPKRGPKRVLVIDDEQLVANSLKRVLRGNDVTVALSGKDALVALAGAPFDVVFCDLMMPGMTGMDVYEQLPPDQQVRFVFTTGGAFTARAQSFLAAVPNQTIDKPFDPQVVKGVIAALDGPVAPPAPAFPSKDGGT